MSILSSKVQAEGSSLSTIIPAEVSRRMGLKDGDEVLWIEDGTSGYHVFTSNPEHAASLRAHGEIMDEYGDVFKALPG